METDRLKYKTISDNKEYFSAYLIMAQHNAYSVLNEISKTVLGKTIDEEEPLYKSELFTVLAENKLNGKNLPPQTTEKIIEKFRHHFPFADPMLQKEMGLDRRIDLRPNDYVALFATLLEYLDVFRNYYTHTNHKMYRCGENLLRYIRSSFDAAVRKVRTELDVEEADVDFLRRLEKKKGARTATEKDTFEYKFFDVKNKNISEKGLAYFICLFLEPKYSNLFLKKLKGFKRDDDVKYRLIHHCYKCYSIRLSQAKLSSENTHESLAMDILNELKRCPSELFNHIDKEDKERFYYDKKMSEEEIEKSQDNEEENVQKQIRKENRFPVLAFSYIDYQEIFDKLRFQIDLGEYHYKFYEKLTVDGKMRLRSLSKKMKGYGRIQDFDEENQPQEWKNLCKHTHTLSAEETENYITQTQAHYHVNNNLIALASIDHLDADNLFPTTDMESQEIMPDFFLSTHELLGLLFYNYLVTHKEGKNKYPSEKLMFEHRKKMFRFFDDIAKEKLTSCTEEELKTNYDLTKREVPERLLLLLGMKEKANSQETLQKQKLEQMITETKLLFNRSKNEEQKAKTSKAGNYKKEKIIKSGDYASYLARDMVFLQKPPKVETSQNHKITSLNFQVLQGSLAFYDRDKELLLKIFEKCNFFNAEMAHPFLRKVCNKCMENERRNNIVNFYQTYLQERIIYLNSCKYNLPQCHFFKSKSQTELKELAQTYKYYPTNLPRGLFKNAITNYLKTGSYGEKMKEFAHKETTSTTFFIEQYFLHCLNGDKPLEYYNFKRTYDVINKVKDDRKSFFKPIAPKYYDTNELTQLSEEIKQLIATLEKQPENAPPNRAGQKPKLYYDQMHNMYKQFCDNEKIIRTYKAQDMMLFLMGKELLFMDKDKFDFKLQDVLFDNSINRNKEKGTIVQKDILSAPKLYEMKVYGKIVYQEDLTPKNYSDFKSFVKDPRLPVLFEWIETKSMERKYLERELEKYDRVRMTVLEKIHLFEHTMFEKYAAELEKRNGANKYYAFNVILDTYQYIHSLDEGEKRFVIEIRNSFSHNQYPRKKLFPSHLIGLIDQEQVTEDIGIITTRRIEMLINAIYNK